MNYIFGFKSVYVRHLETQWKPANTDFDDKFFGLPIFVAERYAQLV